MNKKNKPVEEKVKRKRTATRLTRGKNAAGQTNGQFEQDLGRRGDTYTGAGEPPRMIR
jgi:hypothetical protein